MAGKKQIVAPRKKLMKNEDLGERTSFLDHVYLGCTQRECKPNEIIEEFSKMFESRICILEQLKSYQVEKSLTQRPLRGPKIWEDMLENAWRDAASSQTKVQQLYKVLNPRLDDHIVKQEELESIGELSEVCSQNVLKCLYLARSGINLQEHSQNGLLLATVVGQDWSHTFITKTTTDNIVMWATRLSTVDWVSSKTQICLATLRIQNQPRGSRLRTHKHTFFSRRVENLWRQRSSHQDDYQRTKSNKWDTYPEPTELRLISGSTESI